MIHRKQRDALSHDLQRLVAGQMTNDDFDDVYFDEYETSEDHAVREIAGFGFILYSSDVLRYRLRGLHKVDADDRQTAAQCLLFLRSNLEYEWPSMPDDFRFGCLWALSFNLGMPGGITVLLICVALLVSGEVAFALGLGISGLIVLMASIWTMFGYERTETPEWKTWRANGDFNAWPFIRHNDLVEARNGMGLV